MATSTKQVQNAINVARRLIISYGTTDPAQKPHLTLYTEIASDLLDRAIMLAFECENAEAGNYMDPPPHYGSAGATTGTTNSDLQAAIQAALDATNDFQSASPITGDSARGYMAAIAMNLTGALQEIQLCAIVEAS